MSTTRRVIRKAPTVKKASNKKSDAKEGPIASMASLAEEMQLQILVHVPFERLPQLRLVSSQWNKVINLDAFGRSLCIRKYGNNIAPLRIRDLAQHLDASDSELFLIPTKTQGGSLSVDWLKYFELRSLFEAHLKDWEEELGYDIPTSSELSFASFKTMLNDHFDECHSDCLTPLLLKLIPLLVQYKRIEVARLAVAILTSYEKDGHVLQSCSISYLRLVSGCLDVLELSPTHFPVYIKRLMRIIMAHTLYFTDAIADGLFTSDSATFYRHVFKRVIMAMIHEGARGPLQTTCLFKEYFQQPWRGCYQTILRSLSNPSYNFLDCIVSTCRDTFKNSTDWRVRASALAVCHVSSVDTEKYRRDKLAFALTVLQGGDGNHNEVRRAAFMSIYTEVKQIGLDMKPIAPFLLSSFFNGFLDAIGFLPNNEKPMALAVLKRLMSDYSDHSWAEDTILQLHQTIFKALLIPDVIKSTKEHVHKEIIGSVLDICAFIKQRGQEYLQCYDAILGNLAKSGVTCPEAWLALYIDVGCLMGSTDFIDGAKTIVSKIETETFDFEVPVRKGHFLACCKNAQRLSSMTEDQLIESVLSVFPPYVLDVLDPVVVDEDVPDDDSMSLSSESDSEPAHRAEAMEIDLDVTAVPGPLIVPAKKDSDYEKALSYLPYRKEQWTSAVASLTKGRPNLKRLFSFTEPKPKPVTMPNFIRRLDMSTHKQVTGSSLKAILSTPEVEGAIEKIIEWCSIDDEDEDQEVKKESRLKFMQRFLHVMIARLMSGPVKSKSLACITNLLEMLEPHLDDQHLTRYLASIIGTLSTSKICSTSRFGSTRILAEIDEFQDFMLSMLETRVPDVDPELLTIMLKLRRNDPARDGYVMDDSADVMLRVECLDVLTNLYPRASWVALRSKAMRSVPLCNTGDSRSFIQRLWLVKMYGMRGLAQLTYNDATHGLKVTVESVVRLLNDTIEHITYDPVLLAIVPKMTLYCRLCIIDPEIGPIRIVCSGWNKLTRTNNFAKQLCIIKFGKDIAPLKVNNFATWLSATDAELVFIPVMQDGDKILVDWFQYYDIRSLLRKFLRWLKEDIIECNAMSEFKDFPLGDSVDLKFDFVKRLFVTDFAEGYLEYIPEHLESLLFKLVPLLVRYKRMDLARLAIDRLISPEICVLHNAVKAARNASQLASYEDYEHNVSVIEDLIKMHDIVRIHFPEIRPQVFEILIDVASDYCNSASANIKLITRKDEFVQKTFRKLFSELIRLGSEQEDHEQEYSRMIWGSAAKGSYYPKIINSSGSRNVVDELHHVLLATCSETFVQNNDWRVRESCVLAMLLTHYSVRHFGHDSLRFFNSVLSLPDQHPKVCRAAVVVSCGLLANNHHMIDLPHDHFANSFKHLSAALLTFEPKYRLAILSGLVSLIAYIEVPDRNVVVTENELELLHTNMFKALLTPGVITVDHVGELKKLSKLAGMLPQRIRKYLPQYRETLFIMASDNQLRGDVSSARLLSIYISVAVSAVPSEESVVQEIVQQVEAGTIGFPVDVEDFKSWCRPT